MGNCGSTYNQQRCGALVEKPLDADPGIVGPGVLASFAATALFTFGAIILGYFTKSLPEGYLTDLDHDVVERVASSWVSATSAKAWKAFIRISRRCLFLRPPNKEEDLDEDQRREALKKFTLTLSDQQLVTGIAILVACFANWCRTSVYELNIVVFLAWFSSATHLATLDVLRDYFQRNRVVRNWRMIGMVAIVLLLITGLPLTGFYAPNYLSGPLPCLTYLNSATIYDCNGTVYYTNNTFYFNGTSYDNGTIYANSSYYNNCTQYYGSDTSISEGSAISSFGSAFTVVYLVYGYASALSGTIAISRKTALTPSHILVYLILKGEGVRMKHVSMEVINNAMIESRAEAKAAFDRISAELFNRKGGKRLQQLQLTFVAYCGSFLYHIGGLFFALSYGLSRVAAHRWIDGPSLQAGSNRVDFGQIVPLVLLVLPLLAAAEIFHGKLLPQNDDREVEEVLNKDGTPTPAAIANSEPHGDHESHNTASGENEQVHVPLPDLSGLKTIASTPDISHQLADSYRTPAKSTQSSRVQPFGLVGLIFLYHVLTSIAAGVLLNLNTVAVLAGLPIMIVILYVMVAAYVVEAGSVLKAVIRNNTLDKYRNNTRTADEGIELPAIANEPSSQSAIAAQPSSSADEASHGRDRVIETSVANAAPENSQEMSEHNQGHDSAASQTAVQGQEVQYDADDENRLYISPSRQDTESGLRGPRSSTDVVNEQRTNILEVLKKSR